MNVVFIGTGYVGLVSGSCFSEFGFNVTCVDKQKSKIQDLNNGKLPIYEPGLKDLILRNIKKGKLFFTTNLSQVVSNADVVFISVGTPIKDSFGNVDLKFVISAVQEVAKFIDGYTVIVIKSTVPIGTGGFVKTLILNNNPIANFDVASNPEFLREGSAVQDFMRPDRIILGTINVRSKNILTKLYKPILNLGSPILYVDLETAELIKYVSNAFLATKIAFINEIANLCEACGVDIENIAKGIGLDSRIGNQFLKAGPGYGGSCFPKDTQALIRIAKSYKIDMSILESVIQSNNNRKQLMADKIINLMGGNIVGKTIAILGVTFKANTDDIRESPSIDIIPRLQKFGAKIQAFDPKGMKIANLFLKNIRWFDDVYQVLEGADFCVIITDWNIFKSLNMKKIRERLREPIIIDLRNLYQNNDFSKIGIKYIPVGSPILNFV